MDREKLMFAGLNAQSYLFVPAMRPERIAKAFAAGADEVIVDWEDAVAAEDKAQARALLAQHDAIGQTPWVWLRVNAAQSAYYADDLTALLSLKRIKGVVLPKVERAEQVTALYQACAKPIIAVLETATGCVQLPQIAQAQGLAALSYGCLDLAHELGITLDTPAAQVFFQRLRADLVLHSASNGLNAPLDSVFPALEDEAGLRAYVAFGRDMGMGGVLCIHPKQVAVVKAMLRPSETELAFARAVVAEYQRSQAAVFQVQGKMVDMPVILRAQKLLAQWDV